MTHLQKSTRYALYAAMSMARADGDDPVTAAEVAERYGIPVAVLAKAFQQLMRAGLAVGTRGPGGGYRLAKRSSQLTVLDVVEALEPARGAGRCLLNERARIKKCTDGGDCNLRRVFDEIDELSRNTLASITLETLARPRHSGLLTVASS